MTNASASPTRKRKLDQSSTAEIEVDVSAPEPPSKKALRKIARKARSTPATVHSGIKTKALIESPYSLSENDSDDQNQNISTKRSEHGIWIGNLPWKATKLDLRSFLTKDSSIREDMITRVHMPPPHKSPNRSPSQSIKPQNQGFAYVDFSSNAALIEALKLSESLMAGRRVLIKDSKSFEGRPEKARGEVPSPASSGKPPSKRIFIGNLGFDITKEILSDHFNRCGEVLDIHVATFEDTGKCKGYAWVEFAELEAGEAAVRGWVNIGQGNGSEGEDRENSEVLADQTKPEKKPRLRKWWVNRLDGRSLRMEFAEGKEVRYKKRYGKEGTARNDRDTITKSSESQPAPEPDNDDFVSARGERRVTTHRKHTGKIDARTVKPGAALAAAPRSTGGIVESQGRKTVFA